MPKARWSSTGTCCKESRTSPPTATTWSDGREANARRLNRARQPDERDRADALLEGVARAGRIAAETARGARRLGALVHARDAGHGRRASEDDPRLLRIPQGALRHAVPGAG